MARTRARGPVDIGLPGKSQVVTTKTKFEVYGEELIEKEVRHSGSSGRIYLPFDWIGKQVKIIRVN